MSSLKITMQDKRDLEKFTRFLALKTAQIIVQSRSGAKVNTSCKPNSSGTDWFNLAIQDLPEVLVEAKRALSKEIMSSRNPFCVEISLRTVEGDTMVLETWSLGVLSEHCDPSVRVCYTVYNRMGMLLKSLLSVTRVTPAYMLSRRQGSDSYVICYRIYMGEPELQSLGDNFKQVRIGRLCTPVGMIQLSVFYRTKMTIPPSQANRDSMMLKSDHFQSDFSPRNARYQQHEDSSNLLNDNIKVGAFADNKQVPIKSSINEEEDYADIPFSSLLTPCQTPSPSPTVNSEIVNSIGSQETIDKSNGNEHSDTENAKLKFNTENESRQSSGSMTSTNDDLIMKTPFATTHTNIDLSTFYRECQTAPQLQAFMEEQTLAEQIGDLTKQLEAFETNMYHYESLLNLNGCFKSTSTS